MDFIPVNEPLLTGNEKKYLNECIDTGWISSEGKFVQQLEEGMAVCVGRKYGIAVCNGTAALDTAIDALDLNPGDEVIMPAFTIISCAIPLVKRGIRPVLVDAALDTWNMDVSQIEDKITENTKAIMVVHIYGLPVDMDPVLELAEQYHLKIIEDAAEAHGLVYKGRPCGSFGDISIMSFYPNKHVTSGEGGMVFTNDTTLARRCYEYRNLCFSEERRFKHERIGYNYRMSNLQAAVGVAQLEKLDEHILRKKWMGACYQERLEGQKVLKLPVAKTSYAENIYWVFGLVLPMESRINAQYMMDKLKGYGIGTRPFFYPMHLQPVFQKEGLFMGEHYPVAEWLAEKGFYIPSGLTVTEEQIQYISTMIIKILSEVQ